jgi:large conductance mechanosensitive channel
MKNGDKISGTVVDLGGGKLKVKTTHSGVIVLDWSQVASVKTDAAVKVKLSGGETLEGRVAAGADGKIKVETASGVMALDKVVKFNEPPTEWHGSFDLAGRKTDGNTHNASVLLAGEIFRTTERDRILAKAVFRYDETSGVVEERNTYALAKSDYLFSERIYAYASGELFSDKFKDLTLRSIVAIGVGYIFEKSPEFDFWGDVGIAHVDSEYHEADHESYPGGRISTHVRHILPLGFEVVDDLVLLPNFEESDAWLLRNELALATSLGHGLTFKAGMITDYDNDPPDEVRKHDNTYFFWRRVQVLSGPQRPLILSEAKRSRRIDHQGKELVMIREFREFIMRGNVMDMAVGIIIGGAFGVIVKSLVDDVIMPGIGLILAGIDFRSLAITLKAGDSTTKPVLIYYGVFINAVINFIIIAFVIFMLIKGLNKLKRKPLPPASGPPTSKTCPQCMEIIHVDAKKCKFCTSAVGAA